MARNAVREQYRGSEGVLVNDSKLILRRPGRQGWFRRTLRGRMRWHYGRSEPVGETDYEIRALCGQVGLSSPKNPWKRAESRLDIPGRAILCRLCLKSLQKRAK